MPNPKFTLNYTGQQIADAIAKVMESEHFEFNESSDITLNDVTYHVL
jgi:hypothetical protein